MKRCPVCKASVFDDMPTCFGCMYEFSSSTHPYREDPSMAGFASRPSAVSFTQEDVAGAQSWNTEVVSADACSLDAQESSWDYTQANGVTQQSSQASFGGAESSVAKAAVRGVPHEREGRDRVLESSGPRLLQELLANAGYELVLRPLAR